MEVQNIFPSSDSTGNPINLDIFIYFDVEIDQVRAKDNIMVFGPDFDTTSGPDNLVWVDPAKGLNPYFLKSPGFNGDLQYDMFFDLLNTDNTVFSGLDYSTGGSYKTRVKITPKKPLAPLTLYTVYIIGDEDTTDDIKRGNATRTVFSTELGANTGSGMVQFRGGYSGTTDDQIVIEITEAGNITVAEFNWYLASNPSLVYSSVTSRKWRSLIDLGVDVKFSGSDFVVGDTFTARLSPPTYMTSSYKYSFTTGTGSIQEIPSTTSTSVLGDISTTTSTSTTFEVTSTTPEDKELKVSPNLRIIKIEFSANIDPATITDKSVKINGLPATGYDANTESIGRINKFMLVNDRTLYILLESGTGDQS